MKRKTRQLKQRRSALEGGDASKIPNLGFRESCKWCKFAPSKSCPPRTRKARAGQRVGKVYISQPDARNLNISAPKVGAENLLEEIFDRFEPGRRGRRCSSQSRCMWTEAVTAADVWWRQLMQQITYVCLGTLDAEHFDAVPVSGKS